ncbi:hypothetical protein PN456_19765 [Nodularia spumigena CS-586/05]|uniref:hypothetical protein n=1 Tax=Nodularia spumigena TaxID=70799 RepID=UPI00232B2BE1|nr:hypothetical protein [Nodularia spumigena]MDB9345401.1 hypothetical protein [Nodularia spumigena CS-588/06]MDB9371154.1 hypothetical protein [Nodularia spumigena CS-586/05]
MTTVIFVHGISVREPQLSEVFQQIKGELQKEIPNIQVVPCSWGDSLGAKLNADGASIPLYDSTRNSHQSSQADENIVRWMQLYQDPLYELRLLSLKTPEEQDFIPGKEEPSEKLDKKVRQFSPSNELQDKLKEGGIAAVFSQALQNVVSSNPYQDALVTISDTLTEHRDAIARAIIAEAMAICEREDKSALILTDANLRDEVVRFLSNEITYSEAGIGDWLKEQISKLAISKTTDHVKRRRGMISDITYPAVGDILLYQGRGQTIRNLIKSYIENAEPPVVLLAHSLGGIACVDLLVEEQLKQVPLLITVGSQAPYFYEVNALQSLEFGKTLPEHFPSWLNIYDLQDFLSYIGGNIFPNKVQDILVDNQQPFPRSHGAYWTNRATWKAIVSRIKAL